MSIEASKIVLIFLIFFILLSFAYALAYKCQNRRIVDMNIELRKEMPFAYG